MEPHHSVFCQEDHKDVHYRHAELRHRNASLDIVNIQYNARCISFREQGHEPHAITLLCGKLLVVNVLSSSCGAKG